MKSIQFALFFCSISVFCTLNAQKQIIKDSLSISKTIRLQQKVSFNDYDVKFKKVITDSRCPKNVMCVRAGEAYVLVSIYKNSHFLRLLSEPSF